MTSTTTIQTPFNDWGHEIMEWAATKGFNEMPDPEMMWKALRLLLTVGELAEALEALRHGDKAHHDEEIADTLIRLLHYAAAENIDLDAEVKRKMEINRGRPYKHGKKF